MEIKKTPEADLEKRRIIFFLMGFAVALSGFFVLMQWQSPDSDTSDWTSLGPVFIENEFEGVKRQEQAPPAAAPKNTEQEIVYENYAITNDVPEKPEENAAIAPPETESDETPLFQAENESITAADDAETQADIAASADTLPQFPGGQPALIRFIYTNIRYPSVALKQRIEGRVWCSFVVETDGSISGVQLEKGVYAFLDEEAVRVMKIMPAWIPAQTNGEKIRVKVYIPIVFKR